MGSIDSRAVARDAWALAHAAAGDAGVELRPLSELEDSERNGYRLAYRTAEPWPQWQDERFFLYEPIRGR